MALARISRTPTAGGPAGTAPGGVTRFLLDAPESRNALGLDTATQLREELSAAPDDVFVLGSSTPTTFTAGADLKTDPDTRARISTVLYDCYELMVTRPGPVIAVVEGPAVGGGSQLVCAADLRILGPGARLRFVGAGHGLVIAAWILPYLVGRAAALDLALTSRWLTAEQAVGLGLAAAVTTDPWAELDQLVGHLRGLTPAAVADFKAQVDPGVLARLHAERDRNEGWDGIAGPPAPSPAAPRKPPRSTVR